jgi:hypothetical protein
VSKRLCSSLVLLSWSAGFSNVEGLVDGMGGTELAEPSGRSGSSLNILVEVWIQQLDLPRTWCKHSAVSPVPSILLVLFILMRLDSQVSRTTAIWSHCNTSPNVPCDQVFEFTIIVFGKWDSNSATVTETYFYTKIAEISPFLDIL